jgi:N-acetylglucosamine-6-sulfatase
MGSLLILAYFLLLLGAVFVRAQQDGRSPNIVLILTDDQDLRMNSLDHMPNVQRLLVNEGTSYTRHYAPTALCCPARVSIMTGLHAHNHHVTDVAGVSLPLTYDEGMLTHFSGTVVLISS